MDTPFPGEDMPDEPSMVALSMQELREVVRYAAASGPGRKQIEQARVAVLRRYPDAPAGGNRVAQLMRALDSALRSR